MRDHLEAALPAGADPRQYALVLASMHDAVLSGQRPPAQPRLVIGQSWSRMRQIGIDPDRGSARRPLPPDYVEERRRTSGLLEALPILRDGLADVAEDAALIMVVVDADGVILWREGSSPVRRRADGLGFVPGASWQEDTVGTNAIGTALVARKPIQVYSAEHFVRTHHAWTCACAPVTDPRSGKVLGAVDLSGPAATVNPTTLALVAAVAKLAQSHLRTAHLMDLERLRAVSVPVIAKVAGPAVITDPHGWIAAAAGVAPVDRLALPQDCAAGPVWLPAYGDCVLEPVPGGWLVCIGDGQSQAPATKVIVDVRAPRRPVLTIDGPGGSWTHVLSPRHAEILYMLARHPEGRTATELAADLFGDASRTLTVRAEMSRLRRHFAGILGHRPYRFADGVAVDLRTPEQPDLVLPHSAAPGVRGFRHQQN